MEKRAVENDNGNRLLYYEFEDVGDGSDNHQNGKPGSGNESDGESGSGNESDGKPGSGT